MATSTPPNDPDPTGFSMVNGRLTYDFLPSDLKYVSDLATVRDESYPGEGDPKRRDENSTGHEVHVRGLKGELVVAKYYALSVDESALASGDDGSDFRVRLDGEPTTLDVKVTRFEPPWLQTMETNTTAEHYMGMLVSSARVQFVGFASREELLAGEYGRTTGKNHYNYKLTESELSPPPDPDRIEPM